MAPHPIAQRAARLAVELKELQARIRAEAQDCPKRLVEDRATLELIRELKSAVDAMRMLLWRYIDQQAAEHVRAANAEKLNDATAALRSLRAENLPSNAGESFIEAVSSMVDRYGAKPAA
jgi:hypothetical protein